MITRRTLLGTTAAFTAVAATGLSMPWARAAEPNTLRFASSAGGPRKVDPAQTTQGADNWAVAQMFEYLAAPADGTWGTKPDDFHPVLATSWESSEDARTWTFTLREGVQFHKGYGEMTSDDVVNTFIRARDRSVRQSNYVNVADVKADGKYKVVVTLSDPDPLFIASTIYTRDVAVTSKKAEDEKGFEGFGTDAIGTGPYQMDRFDSEEGTFLSRHPDYWGEKPAIEKIDCLYIADTTARTLALISGDIDMAEGVRAPGWIDQMKAQKPGLEFDMTVPGSFNTLFFNLSKDPLQNILVRKAIAHGINKQQIVDALQPMSRMTWTINPPTYPTGFTEEELPEDLRYEYNPEKSKALLKEAGFGDGLKIPVNTSQREDYSSQHLIIQEQLRAVGIDLDLKIMDHSAYHGANRKNLNTLNINSWSLPPIPLYVFNNYASKAANMVDDGTGGANYSHYGVLMPGVDDLLAEMQKATSFDKYIEIGRQVELQIQKDLPMFGLPTLSYVVARNPRIDLGYEVKGGNAYWSFAKATIVS